MSSTAATGFRPRALLRIPLQTGNGFGMSLFMVGFFFVPALFAALFGILLLVLGHWLIGPVLFLLGGFFVGAFFSFPRETWLARPSDLELDGEGFRVIGGYHGGVSMKWDELDAAASGLRDGLEFVATQLVAVTRAGKLVPVAEGDERESFAAVIDVWRAAQGLEPFPARAWLDDSELLRMRDAGSGKRRKQTKAGTERAEKAAAQAEPVTVELVGCGRCGAPACPEDASHSRCLYCGESVPMPEALRRRLRELGSGGALKRRSQRALERLLDHPSALATSIPMTLLALGMLGSWLFGAGAVARALLRASLDLVLLLQALAAPLLLTIVLALLASLVASRRVAVRAVAVDFAAVAPLAAGKPCQCRVCGAPLPLLGTLVVRCAYCTSPNVVQNARPRTPTHRKDQARTLEHTLDRQRTEQLTRLIFLALCGLPALWGASVTLLALWRRMV